ncbi:NADH-quinone oxidoreductase subunit L [Nakamurella leprariae]|uniref:NADH-quinone oxidoreductase subunit L n=1 Tax=Nakamurella leprariae TaxID=2803911 RepID=A0A939BXQ4_9ACTN|nr:NADH-quinone oxidoreductase subunit L [Nakamurella leprariae]MBM9466240.1 NADH-quinone oxidoreductase subunit L [Nakamurella leprariae]
MTGTGTGVLAALLIALPALGAAVLLLAGRRTDRWGHLLGCATVIAAFVVAVVLFATALGQPDDARFREVELFTWMNTGSFDVPLGLLIDPLALTFALLITGVGALIHIYSIGYMSHDADRRKFFAYLNLFVAAMLLLVLGNSFVTLYFGWEGVGLASYLLIGFWSDRPAAATAAKKAFVMNRVGDVGLALAIFWMFAEFGTVTYTGVFDRIGELAAESPGVVTGIALLLLLGACGKSGQVPLQAWLPDAMEGPTPVSALIHAATMVTAGVYLIARCAPIYDLTPDGRLVVAIVGTVTLLLGCIAGCAKDDIKKVLAYSTVSQIGYMFLAVGLGAGVYALGILHLLTHGFFKAGLFLGAGSVMHAMRDDVDMRHYGGLARRMPITFVTMGLGYLALIGFPFLSGFWSKDPIIEAAYAAGGTQGVIMGTAALLGAGLTAFYMTRLMIMTFLGRPRWEAIAAGGGGAPEPVHPHDPPPVMTGPMIVLAIGSVAAGAFLALGDRLAGWLAPSVGPFEEPHPAVAPIVITIATLVVIAAGIVVAWLLIGRRPVPVVAPARVSPLVAFARADVGGNWLNETLVAKPGVELMRGLLVADRRGVDGAVHGTATVVSGLAGWWRRWQNGFVRSYALSMLAGVALVVGAVMVVSVG